jgi:hypothetical protein
VSHVKLGGAKIVPHATLHFTREYNSTSPSATLPCLARTFPMIHTRACTRNATPNVRSVQATTSHSLSSPLSVPRHIGFCWPAKHPILWVNSLTSIRSLLPKAWSIANIYFMLVLRAWKKILPRVWVRSNNSSTASISVTSNHYYSLRDSAMSMHRQVPERSDIYRHRTKVDRPEGHILWRNWESNPEPSPLNKCCGTRC